MTKKRLLPTIIVALVGAIIGSFVMMLYASTHFPNIAGPNHTPPAAVAAAPLQGVSDQARIVSAVKRTKGSVVAIDVQINGKRYTPFNPLFQQFFGQQGPEVVQPYKEAASGSGFVYSSNGLIVTNAHVVLPPNNAKVTKMTVIFANGNKIPAHLVAASVGADIAIIKVNNYAKLPPPLQLADSDKLQQGQWAIAIGEPLQLQQTVTLGIVSAFDRSEHIPNESGQIIDFKGLLQTSAQINPGNSGGPLLNINGKVIGINQSTVRSAYAQGIGFAIPSNTVKTVVAELEKHPGIQQGTGQGYLGILMRPLTPGLRNQIGYTGKNGVPVIDVVPGSPADRAGIQPGDVILRVNGKPVSTVGALQKEIAAMKPGDEVRLDVWAQGLKKL
ncbi:MAG: S1C family serine protease, partial [Vulcanimicrobiaceae bacterium]